MKYAVTFPTHEIKGSIELPTSKSISNRLLIIKALSLNADLSIDGLSDCDDTKVMQQALQTSTDVIDAGPAGTAMRFLTAYFAATAQTKTITGSDEMKNRPVGDLVDALNKLGADIVYLEKTGFPPIRTSGKTLSGNSIEINGNISSQFITALLLVAPTLPEGLTIQIKGVPVSLPYIKMSLQLMKQAGVSSTFSKNVITVAPQEYRSESCIQVERDRSAASYWYQIAALTNDAELLLEGVNDKSLQGDAAISLISYSFGVKTEYTPEGALLSKFKHHCRLLWLDFSDIPDIVQTMAVTCCLTDIHFRFTGVQTLRVKETDRIAALQNELLKLGYCIKEIKPGVIEWYGERTEPQKNITISTYNDHRMAMAFAPAAIRFPGLSIENPDVVSKSYPRYWEDLRKVGVELRIEN